MTKTGDVFRWIHSRIINRPTNFSWVIRDRLAGSGMLVTYSQFLWVLAQGIKTVISVREGRLPSHWFTDGNASSIDYLYLNVEDHGAPSLEQLDNTVDYIKSDVDKGKPVMVHCAAGKGRTGTILAAYMVKEEDLTADLAIEKIRRLRPGSIDSETQEKCIEAYEQFLKRTNKG